ncbi:hypothetical protein J3F83DRAFT_85980 [Trichoderma novae-zelandiae]
MPRFLAHRTLSCSSHHRHEVIESELVQEKHVKKKLPVSSSVYTHSRPSLFPLAELWQPHSGVPRRPTRLPISSPPANRQRPPSFASPVSSPSGSTQLLLYGVGPSEIYAPDAPFRHPARLITRPPPWPDPHRDLTRKGGSTRVSVLNACAWAPFGSRLRAGNGTRPPLLSQSVKSVQLEPLKVTVGYSTGYPARSRYDTSNGGGRMM